MFAQIAWTTELGLYGLVVSGLFSLVTYVIFSSNKREDKRCDNFNKTLKEISDRHSIERKDWKTDICSLERETNTVIKELTTAIKEVLLLHKGDD